MEVSDTSSSLASVDFRLISSLLVGTALEVKSKDVIMVTVSKEVGNMVGTDVGILEGNFVGTPVGLKEGPRTGASVGKSDGRSEVG